MTLSLSGRNVRASKLEDTCVGSNATVISKSKLVVFLTNYTYS